MSERGLIKHPIQQRIVHWFNAASFLFLWLTGIAIISNSGYQVGPTFYVNFVNSLFGGATNLLRIHVYVGIFWFVIMVVSFLVDPHGLSLRFLKDLLPTKNDLLWFKERPKAEMDPSTELPDQGAYNAGQKAFGFVVVIGSVVIGTSGLLMWFGTGGGAISRWMVLIHLITVGVVIAFFFVHFSMAALITEERPALVSMIKGDVEEEYAEHHHAEWYREHSEVGEPIAEEERFGLPRAVYGWAKRVVLSLHNAKPQKFGSPYVAGIGLGLAVLFGMVALGHGPGSSGFFSRLGAYGLAEVAPDHVAANSYWGPVLDRGLWDYWLTWAVGGIAIGGFLSALLAGRIKFGIDRGSQISPRARLGLALGGGLIVGFATRLTRGCTSHHISEAALLSLGSWLFLGAVFIGGFATAFAFKKVWR
ncbi:MAG: cytochrome b/b6 domain-containing protein [Actinomycetota bacterium]